ncbi:hypothetical protein Psch_02315 [Pelotomaculum schinkii]|uniref:Uncharacterized protein n=1 Tax=Pelotomaculum schinkii TaxID=78350 RepID=A0A4Y7R8I2_9FIRM|nr:hypothetical protein [Pelotomaculum schinkii]TEB05274.1 hypothetical protein Psch_02315 [Pelotomaculum schinkii]
MAKQLLLNRGFENGLANYYTEGKVSDFGDIANSGIKSALLLSSPTSAAEISQVIFYIVPGAPVRFSFFVRKINFRFAGNVSNIRAEVNFLNLLGTTIASGIVINIRGRDLGQNAWYRYEEYGEIPLDAVAARVLIRLKPSAFGTSGILVDDLALVSDVFIPVLEPPLVLTPPVQQEAPVSFIPPENVKPAYEGIPCHENRYITFKC